MLEHFFTVGFGIFWSLLLIEFVWISVENWHNRRENKKDKEDASR